MEPKNFAKQMIDFHKASFNNSFSAMVMMQEQTERMVTMSMDQATWLPEEGKRVISDWLKAYKKGRDDFKKIVDDNFEKLDALFPEEGKAEKAKVK
jgi:hypothetical protein